MKTDAEAGGPGEDGHHSLLILALVSLVVGALTGLVGAVFRIALEHADRLRDTLIYWAHGQAIGGFAIVVCGCGVATFVAAGLVRRFAPQASGSGIPHVEAVLHGQIPPAPVWLVPVKFVGGILSIGSGLALGREGPSVQMGASIAVFTGQVCGLTWQECRVLLAAGAGAGLATAFNAPIAGAVFVLEELVQKFERRIAIAALAASATAIAIGRLLLGDAPDFVVVRLGYAGFLTHPLFFVLGAFAGLLGVLYNRALLAAIARAERLRRVPVEVQAGLIGGAVGVLAWVAPNLVGGGDGLTQRALTGQDDVAIVLVIFSMRFVLSIMSYTAAVPGGLFAPLLVLGAQSGLVFGALCQLAFPGLDIQREAFALVGMAAFFIAVVRAPVTGIVLVTEMTANVTMLLPMLGAGFMAMLVPTLLGNMPIYDSLRAGTLRREQTSRLSQAAALKSRRP